MTGVTTLNETLRSPIDGTEFIRLATPGFNWKATILDMFIVETGPPTTSNLAPGHFGLFKNPDGSIVLAVNDGGIIHTVILVASGLLLMEDGISFYLLEDGTSRFLIE